MAKKPTQKRAHSTSVKVFAPEQLTAMFLMYCKNNTLRQIALEYCCNYQYLRQISSEQKWSEMRETFRKKQYAMAIQSMQSSISDVLKTLIEDYKLLDKDRIGQMRQLDKDERKHLIDVLDRMLKETRLEDGKPTEIPGGVTQIELIMPREAERHGVYPVGTKIKYTEDIEVKPEDKLISTVDPEDA